MGNQAVLAPVGRAVHENRITVHLVRRAEVIVHDLAIGCPQVQVKDVSRAIVANTRGVTGHLKHVSPYPHTGAAEVAEMILADREVVRVRRIIVNPHGRVRGIRGQNPKPGDVGLRGAGDVEERCQGGGTRLEDRPESITPSSRYRPVALALKPYRDEGRGVNRSEEHTS